FLGINLVRHLLGKGHSVTSYDIAPFDYPERDVIDVVTGDIRDPSKLGEAMSGADVVVHAAAALPLYSEEDIHTTDVVGTTNVMEAAQKNRIERVVLISSTAVYGLPKHPPILESTELVGVGPYGKAKIEAERIAASYRERGMVVPIIRPKSFVGPERLGVFGLLFDWAKDGKNFPILGNGKNRYQLLDVEDLCEAIELCMTLDRARVNDVFNIGAKDFTTMREDWQSVLDSAGHGKKVVGLPAAPAITLLRVLEALHVSPLYKWVYETAAKDSFVSIEKAKSVLGFTPKFSNKDALVRNYEWYLANYERFAAQSGVTHRVPWKQGALRLAKAVF
ncbi:MAG TPA: NAD(P)-dependent oxidoreductase, partial [Polyangiaceae bacterium]